MSCISIPFISLVILLVMLARSWRAKSNPGKNAGSVHIDRRYGGDRGRSMATLCIRKAWDAGATIIAGSDSGLTVFPQGGLLEEVCTYVEQVGLGEHEAVLTATRGAATVIGLGNEVGTLEPGELADLVVYRESPLERIRVLTEPDQVVAVLKSGSVVAGDLEQQTKTADAIEEEVAVPG